MKPKQRAPSGSRKIFRPHLHNAMSRPRLFELLDDVADRPVTAVLAPAGYGKTTLVSSYLESKQVLSIWYSVDEGDIDLASFFAKFTEAVQQATPESRETILQYQAENFLNIKVFTRRYFESVYLRLDQSFHLVFDDIHECITQQWGDVIAMAIEGLPVNGRVFIIGRQALPAQFSRLCLNQQIYTLREKELHFSNDEVIELATIHNITTLSSKQCNKLQEVMAGWGAGLTLLLSRRENIDNVAMYAFDTQEDLQNYFKEEVLRNIDSQTLDVLYRTCYLPDLPIENALLLTQNPQVANILQKLHDQRFFTYRVTNSAIVYRYHPLFRTILMAQGREALSDKDLQQTLDISIDLLEKDHTLEDAVTLLTQLNNVKRLVDFTILHARELLSGNRMQTLMKCLQYIPTDILEASGWLLYWRGMCTVMVRPKMARQDFSNAFDFFRSDLDTTGQCLSIAGIIDSYMFERDEFVSIDPWLIQVENLQEEFDQSAPPPALNALSLNMLSALLHRAPGHQDFDVWLERVERIPMSELPPGLRIKRQLTLILHGIWHGDFHRATRHHGVLESQLKNTPEHVSNILWYTIHCCFLWSTTAHAQLALEVAKEGLARVKEYNLPLMSVGLLMHGTAAALMIHKNEEAKRLLDEAAPFINESGQTHLAFYHMLHTIYSYRNNDNEAAHHHTKASLNAALASGLPFFQGCAHFVCAQLYMLCGDVEKSWYHLNASNNISIQTNNFYQQFQNQLLSAILDWSNGRQDSAICFLKKSLSLAKQYGLLPGLWIFENELARVMAEALRHDIEITTAQKIISHRQLMPEILPYDIECWPWPIRIYTLGRFEIHINGKRLESPSRNRPKLFALLKTLIAFGGTKVREEVICEAIWPDADGDAAHQLFDTTLFRLRKTLGLRDVLINREGALSLNKRLCWLDTWALDLEITRLKLSIKDENVSTEVIKQQEKLLDLYYKDDFLHSEDNLSITIHQRQIIRSKLLVSLYQLSHYWLSNDRKAAERSLNRIISIFPQEEKACQLLMRLFRSQGRYSDAARTYHVCKQTLKTELNVNPSSETEYEYMKLPGS